MIKFKRVYKEPKKNDGFRVLVDRLWPRGISKEKAKLDLWLKAIAPSGALRKWFGHDPKKWRAFRKKYTSEIMAQKGALHQLKEIVKKRGTITLLYAARDERHNGALIIKRLLRSKSGRKI